MKHLNESPPRKYTYEEWVWFLKLIGEDEGDHTFHRKPPVKINNDSPDKEPDTQQAQIGDNEGNTRQWSWLGNRSPLMGETEEAEWVLERLSITLEKELKKQSDAKLRSNQASRGAHIAKKVESSSGSSKTSDNETKSSTATEKT